MALVDMKSSLLTLTYYQPDFNRVPADDAENKLEATLKNSLDKGSPALYTEQNKYAMDRFGAGYSGLPYIKTKIPGRPNSYTSGTQRSIIDPTTTGRLDYPIRGGEVNFEVGQQTYTNFGRVDRERIIKFLKDAPRGESFLKKQVGLQLTNPKIETGMLYGIVQNTRFYEPKGENMLMQVTVSGTGAHALRHGNVPFNPIQKTYFATVNEQNVLGSGNEATGLNRLLILRQLKMISGKSSILSAEEAASMGASLNMSKVNDLGISLNRNILFQYLGGPGSSYGIGATTIGRVVDTTTQGSANLLAASRTAMNYNMLAKQASTKNILAFSNSNIQDFRSELYAQSKDEDGAVIGEPWSVSDSVDYRFYVSNRKIDKLNKMMPFVFKNDSNPWDVTSQKDSSQDLIKFVFEAISNDNNSYSTAIFFRAFLTAGITDNNTAAINSFKYIGRGENFYTYQGFERNVNFSFRVAAHSKEELKPMYNRLNALVSQVYPDYSPNTQIMRAPLMRITVGDYLFRMPGLIESVNLTVGNDMPWEITNNAENSDLAQVPQVVDVSIAFKPILTELPRRYGNSFTQDGEVSVNLNDSNVSTTSKINSEVPRILANSTNNANKFIEGNSFQGLVSSTRKATEQEIAAAKEREAKDKKAGVQAEQQANQDINRKPIFENRMLRLGNKQDYRIEYPNLYGGRRYEQRFIKAGSTMNE